MLSNFLKGLAAITVVAASPVLIVFIVPLGCGVAGDVLNSTDTLAALALTAAVGIAAFSWARYRAGDSRNTLSRSRGAKSLG